MNADKDTKPMSAEDVGIEIISEMDREFNESPDRVIAIVGGAYIDDMLERLFRAVLIDVSKEVDNTRSIRND